MKIILEHEELILLQEAARTKSKLHSHFISSRPRNVLRVLSELWEAGLVKADGSLYRNKEEYTQLFGPITITPRGQKVLNDSLPWIDPENKKVVLGSSSAFYGFGNRRKVVDTTVPPH